MRTGSVCRVPHPSSQTTGHASWLRWCWTATDSERSEEAWPPLPRRSQQISTRHTATALLRRGRRRHAIKIARPPTCPALLLRAHHRQSESVCLSVGTGGGGDGEGWARQRRRRVGGEHGGVAGRQGHPQDHALQASTPRPLRCPCAHQGRGDLRQRRALPQGDAHRALRGEGADGDRARVRGRGGGGGRRRGAPVPGRPRGAGARRQLLALPPLQGRAVQPVRGHALLRDAARARLARAPGGAPGRPLLQAPRRGEPGGGRHVRAAQRRRARVPPRRRGPGDGRARARRGAHRPRGAARGAGLRRAARRGRGRGRAPAGRRRVAGRARGREGVAGPRGGRGGGGGGARAGGHGRGRGRRREPGLRRVQQDRGDGAGGDAARGQGVPRRDGPQRDDRAAHVRGHPGGGRGRRLQVQGHMAALHRVPAQRQGGRQAAHHPPLRLLAARGGGGVRGQRARTRRHQGHVQPLAWAPG